MTFVRIGKNAISALRKIFPLGPGPKTRMIIGARQTNGITWDATSKGKLILPIRG